MWDSFTPAMLELFATALWETIAMVGISLAAGNLDANSYRHKPYLDAQVKDRGYKIVPVGYTVNFPIGIYSKKVKDLKDLKEGARVGIRTTRPTAAGCCWCSRTRA